MEPQERGRGEGKEEGRGERRIMAELLTTPWSAKKDFHSQCAGVDTTADTQRRVMDTGPRLVRTGVSIKSGSNRKERAAGLGERSGKSSFLTQLSKL